MDLPAEIFPIDIAVLAILLVGAIQGYKRGLSGELARLIAVVIAFMTAIRFYRPVSLRIAETTAYSEKIAEVLAFATTMLGAILVMLILRAILKRLIQVVVNEQFDRVAGMLAGITRTALFSAAILIMLLLWPQDDLNRTIREKSRAGAALTDILPHIEAFIGSANLRLPPATAPADAEAEQPEDTTIIPAPTTNHTHEVHDAARSPIEPAL